MGFYCALHGYQRPRPAPGGSSIIVEPAYEAHLRTRTSFVSPEHSTAAEMAKSPGLVRSGAASGSAISAWLQERRSLDVAGARAYASRMLALEILVPLGGSGGGAFLDSKDAQYRLTTKLNGANK